MHVLHVLEIGAAFVLGWGVATFVYGIKARGFQAELAAVKAEAQKVFQELRNVKAA
jgi:hypothetical protein